MKFNTQGLVLVIVFQLMIAGATLSITATNAEAIPCNLGVRSAVETVNIGVLTGLGNAYSPHSKDYLTTGVGLNEGSVSELEFRNECKEYNRLPLIFRQEIKTTHEKCEGIGDVCFFSASAGCGIEDRSDGGFNCLCEIGFNYCTQTTEGIGSEDKIERSFGGKN